MRTNFPTFGVRQKIIFSATPPVTSLKERIYDLSWGVLEMLKGECSQISVEL